MINFHALPLRSVCVFSFLIQTFKKLEAAEFSGAAHHNVKLIPGLRVCVETSRNVLYMLLWTLGTVM